MILAHQEMKLKDEHNACDFVFCVRIVLFFHFTSPTTSSRSTSSLTNVLCLSFDQVGEEGEYQYVNIALHTV